MVGLRVHFELTNVPQGWPDHVDLHANHAATMADGSLFLSWREQRDEGVDLRTGNRTFAVENRLVRVFRGGSAPTWRWVEPCELPDAGAVELAEEPAWPAPSP